MPVCDPTENNHLDPERLFTAYEVAELIGVSSRTVLLLPIRQIRLGTRIIRYRLRDVYEYVGIENPNL